MEEPGEEGGELETLSLASRLERLTSGAMQVQAQGGAGDATMRFRLDAALQFIAGDVRFVPLVGLLERLTAGSVRVGGDGPPTEEAIRFRHDPALIFSAGDVSQVKLVPRVTEWGEQQHGPRHVFEVVTTFLGLTGASSPLPGYLVEEIAQEDPDRPLKREFLDLFHHRLVSLLYRALSRYLLEGEATRAGDDVWSRRVLALAGLDTYERGPQVGLSVAQLLRLAPLLATRARTGRTLELALTDVLRNELGEARVTVRQFAGSWVDVEPEQRMMLGKLNSHLGRSSMLGGRLFDRAGKFIIGISPLDGPTYHRLLPEGDLSPLVREVVTLVVRDPLECAMELGVREDVLGAFQITQKNTARLGRNTYLGGRRGAVPRLRTRVVTLPQPAGNGSTSASP
ncbi:type VI secretion system baseplate subunit TssG [Hyalangium rubrum]|uniref:Type VI secretion system baseplate subunit TssG n=1 Tax=Hyalangium rubrum TaxID=3103134 RepID=A0ABU5HCS6_9BACT|nr:type VI secretion system baseplate subunit TssG [Hyalangium sp. s54d21]MDY7230947.1 type VI secretion system baseplate subunit TssG [Hyalangium sp. s54d21]